MSRSGVGRVGAGRAPVRASERGPVADNRTVEHFADRDNVEAFLAHVADCGSVRAYCREWGLNQLHFMRMVENDAEFGEWYTTARKMRAHNMADDSVGLVADMRSGELSAQEVGAAAKVYQWDASKHDRDTYGEAARSSVTVNLDLRGALAEARGRVSVLDGEAVELIEEGGEDTNVVNLDDGGIVLPAMRGGDPDGDLI